MEGPGFLIKELMLKVGTSTVQREFVNRSFVQTLFSHQTLVPTLDLTSALSHYKKEELVVRS